MKQIEKLFGRKRLAGIVREFLIDYETLYKSYYPSSGTDIIDVVYFNEQNFKLLKIAPPRIFIHNDSNCHIGDNSFYGNNLLKSIGHYITDKTTQQSIKIFKMKNHLEENVWLIHFGGFSDDEILKMLIADRTIISQLYTKCNGESQNEGRVQDHRIPAVFYPFFYDTLGLKFHLTEQNIPYALFSIGNTNINLLRIWLRRVLQSCGNSFVESLVTVEDNLLANELYKFFDQIKEILIDTNSYSWLDKTKYLRVYG